MIETILKVAALLNLVSFTISIFVIAKFNKAKKLLNQKEELLKRKHILQGRLEMLAELKEKFKEATDSNSTET